MSDTQVQYEDEPSIVKRLEADIDYQINQYNIYAQKKREAVPGSENFSNEYNSVCEKLSEIILSLKSLKQEILKIRYSNSQLETNSQEGDKFHDRVHWTDNCCKKISDFEHREKISLDS